MIHVIFFLFSCGLSCFIWNDCPLLPTDTLFDDVLAVDVVMVGCCRDDALSLCLLSRYLVAR